LLGASAGCVGEFFEEELEQSHARHSTESADWFATCLNGLARDKPHRGIRVKPRSSK
jgi:hypothetical protein